MFLCPHDIRRGSVGSGQVHMVDCNSCFFVPMTLGEEVLVVGRLRWWAVIVASLFPLSHDIRRGIVSRGKVQMVVCISCFFVPMTLEEELWVVGRFR